MSTQTQGLNMDRTQRQDEITQTVGIMPGRRYLFLRVTIVVFTGMAIGISGLALFAKTAQLPRVVEPPSELLPGNPVPASIACDTPFDHRFRCHVSLEGEEIYLNTDNVSQRIVGTSITARKQTLGSLIVAWGTPIGFSRLGVGTYVYWNTRWVYLVTCSLEPHSLVEFIAYSPISTGIDEPQRLPWRGFVHEQTYSC